MDAEHYKTSAVRGNVQFASKSFSSACSQIEHTSILRMMKERILKAINKLFSEKKQVKGTTDAEVRRRNQENRALLVCCSST